MLCAAPHYMYECIDLCDNPCVSQGSNRQVVSLIRPGKLIYVRGEDCFLSVAAMKVATVPAICAPLMDS